MLVQGNERLHGLAHWQAPRFKSNFQNFFCRRNYTDRSNVGVVVDVVNLLTVDVIRAQYVHSQDINLIERGLNGSLIRIRIHNIDYQLGCTRFECFEDGL